MDSAPNAVRLQPACGIDGLFREDIYKYKGGRLGCHMQFASVEEAIDEIRKGRFVIILDDENRENEGDLCMAADKVTPEAINFMAKFGRGLICLSMEEEQLEQLHLGMMVPDYENSTPFGTAFTVSIEAREGVTTGISAADRARTIQVAVAPDAKPT